LRQSSLAAEAMAARQAGDADHAILFFGQDAGLIDSIKPAAQIVDDMVREALEILSRRLPSLFGPR
jgi:NAD(P)H-dependent flavin oxidoreductase YrpB (nitropropane dioxygenase family)